MSSGQRDALRKLLGTELPIIQAPMAGAQLGKLAAAASSAGGLGSLPCAMLAPDGIRAEIETITAATASPYNVNFFCHSPPTRDETRERRWRELLLPYYRELGVDPDASPPAPRRLPFGAEAADVLDEFRPRVVSFHFGLPSPALLARVRSWGAVVLSSATTVEEARWLEAHGVDAVIAQGLEAGGHRGHFLPAADTMQLGTFALVPRIVASVSIPVIAAGGIADSAGVAAAFALGAAGVQVGTAYLLCPEATTSAVHRAALASEASAHTAITNVMTGRPARGIVNRLMRELGPCRDDMPEFPLAADLVAPLRAKAENAGSGDFSPLWCGQNVRAKAAPAAEVTRELASGL